MGQTLLRCESFQRGYETPADRTHQRPRRQRLTTMVAEESHNSQLGLEPRHIDIQVQPIDPLHRKLDMIGENFRHTLCYHLPGSGRAGLPSRRFDHTVQTEPPGLPELVMKPAIGATVSTAPLRRRRRAEGTLRLRLRPTRQATTYQHRHTPRRSEAEPR